MTRHRSRYVLGLTLGLAFLAIPAEVRASEPTAAAAAELGASLPWWSALPFVGILLSIALFPLVAPRFWHHHYPKVAAFWALVLAGPFLLVFRGEAAHEILYVFLVDYIPFIVLLWGLFTVAGGIVVHVRYASSPGLNTALLAIGTVLASWMGTTGASMVMIRPVMRANAGRRHRVHVIVFFIFLVSNIGGSLTPLGDPPLFLGFIHGVPFFWTLSLFPHMALMSGILLVVFYVVDRRYRRLELRTAVETAVPPSDDAPAGPRVRVEGVYNVVFLLGIMGFVLVSGLVPLGDVRVLGVALPLQNVLSTVGVALMGGLAWAVTPGRLRKANDFSWAPIREVAYLFAGIFMTIIAPLAILKAGVHGDLRFLITAVEKPWQYFWATGVMSSFLDNAPTYLTFFNTALGRMYEGVPEAAAVARLIAENPVFLEAIAAGAVFMGANTYIGNAPNFMVRSIAEEAGIRMPSFFGYMIRWSIPILLPAFALVTWLFF